jgi:Bacteriophage protein of unknown function (DUF646).
MAVTVQMRARVDENHLQRAMRGYWWLEEAWVDNTATYQKAFHREEAPLGRAVYTDEEGHDHPGWLRDSVDSVPLPGETPSTLVTVHAFYGIYVNNGTRHQAPNPFWDRAQVKTEREAPLLLDRLTAQMLVRYLR